jgi:isopentenyl-diphosphate delta-isomerase
MNPLRGAEAARPTRPEASRAERDRKLEHIRLALETRMQLAGRCFDDYVFEHQALPEIDFAEIDTSVTFLGRSLRAPLLISCMTGGNDEAARINRHLARGAEQSGIAVGVGSQRKAIEDDSTVESFEIRPLAPSVPILANLGAVQLNYGFGVRECRRAIEMIDADALVFHLNPLQEAIQPEGQRNFRRLLPKMGAIARELDVPVIVKEIGCGISAGTARGLLSQGIRIVDTAGVGGTTWARIEAARARNSALGELFADWGIPTPTAIEELREIDGLTVIGSGGIRNGLDVPKAIALGADLAGMAYPFLRAAGESAESVTETVRRTMHELKIAMFCVGARTIDELAQAPLLRHGTVPPEAPALACREGRG